MSEKTAIYPGFFDPITNGHLSIVTRALKVFDNLIIAILNNPKKDPLFSTEERIYMIKKSIGGKKTVEVDSFDGLLVDYAVKKNHMWLLEASGPSPILNMNFSWPL